MVFSRCSRCAFVYSDCHEDARLHVLRDNGYTLNSNSPLYFYRYNLNHLELACYSLFKRPYHIWVAHGPAVTLFTLFRFLHESLSLLSSVSFDHHFR